MQVETVINNLNKTPTLFDLNDIHQAPNLSYFDFKPYPREVWFKSFEKMYGKPPPAEKRFRKEDPTITTRVVANVVDGKATELIVGRDEYIERLDAFINTWIDRYIASGKLEVMPDGLLRRAIAPVRVHWNEPTDRYYCRDCESHTCEHVLEDTSEQQRDGVPYREWLDHPERAAELREKFRLAAPAKLSTGELERLLKKASASSEG